MSAEHSDLDDDALLIAALMAGDERAFGYLLDSYSGLLHRIARNYVSSDAVADEVVADTWLAVIQGIARFERRSSLKTWIIRILTNRAKSRGVKESRSLPFSSVAPGDSLDGRGGWDSSAFLADDHPTWPGAFDADVSKWGSAPLAEALSAEVLDTVRVAMINLPVAQRTVFDLRDVQGWTSEEVCEALDLSEGNQRVLLHRARGRVRRALDTYLTSDRGES